LEASSRKTNQQVKFTSKRRAKELTAISLNLFAERDFASVTIKDIANKCGVNTALIYYYFENKEDLFRATIQNAISDALENYTSLRNRHTNPVDLISDWFDTNLKLSVPIRKLVKIMLDYSGSGMNISSIDQQVKNFYYIEHSILSDSIRQGIDQGIFNAVEHDRLALFVSTHLDGVMVASMIRKDFNLSEAMADLREILWLHLGLSSDQPLTQLQQNPGAA